MKYKIYLSGKISGLSKKNYTENFNIAERYVFSEDQFELIHDLVEIINPLDLKPFLGIKKYWCYMITDIYHLSKCTHIAVQKNWIDSKGAFIEVFFAKFIFKIEVIYLRNHEK